jgi:hypothetical protein
LDDVLINFGGGIEAKSVGNGLTELRGPSVIFDPHDGEVGDLAAEYFASDSYFGPGVTPGKTAEFEATFNHGVTTTEGLKALTDYEFKNSVKTEVTDAAVIASLLLDEREEYEKMLADFARENPGKLGWSTATASHRAKREQKADGRTWIKRWPIVEIAVTHQPCEPRTSATIPLKSYIQASESQDYFVKAATAWNELTASLKSGRVLSDKNRRRVQELRDELQRLLDETAPVPSETEKNAVLAAYLRESWQAARLGVS